MRRLDLKELFCPLEFEDFSPPFGSPPCLFTYKEINFPFSMRTLPCPPPPCRITYTQSDELQHYFKPP